MTQSRWSDDADHQTARAVQAAFAGIHMTQSVATTVDAHAATMRPRAIHKGRRWVTAVASAAAAVAIAVGVTVAGGSGSAAWAAVPTTPTVADAEMAVEQCNEPFAAPDRGGASPIAPVNVDKSTLQLLDIRGTGAIAIFTEADSSLVCTLAQVDGIWQFAGSTGSDEPADGLRGAIAGLATTLPDGGQFSSLHGYADSGTVAVTVTLASGVQAEASVAPVGDSTQFAVWFPVAVDELAGATVTAVDAKGGTTVLPTLSIR